MFSEDVFSGPRLRRAGVKLSQRKKDSGMKSVKIQDQEGSFIFGERPLDASQISDV